MITKDNVTVDVDAVVYFRITDPEKAVVAHANHTLENGVNICDHGDMICDHKH